MNSCRQTKPSNKYFNLIVDDTGHRRSGTLTEGIGRQLGKLAKYGIVMVTTHHMRWSKKFTIRCSSIAGVHADSLEKGCISSRIQEKNQN